MIYEAIASLDGFVEDRDGSYDWAVPDEEVHAFINDLARDVGTYLFGCRMYEEMVGWENDPKGSELQNRSEAAGPPADLDRSFPSPTAPTGPSS